MADAASDQVRIFPNPTRDGVVHVPSPDARWIKAYDAAGKRVPLMTQRDAAGWRCILPMTPGVYHLVVGTPHGEQLLRVVRTGE
jgi:hypothetical protein